MERLKGRQLKARVLALLQGEPLDATLTALAKAPSRRVVNPLFSFFLHSDPRIRWRAIAAMGAVVAPLAEKEMESARVVMRRLMWSLNDESGGIGWGAPEAMGEIMAQSEPMAGEYARILISYIDPAGNYLEHPGLQRGVLWGIGRLARARPEHTAPAVPFLSPYLASDDPYLRGLAAWIGTAPGMGPPPDRLRDLAGDPAVIEIFLGRRLQPVSVGALAAGAGPWDEKNPASSDCREKSLGTGRPDAGKKQERILS